MEQHKTHIIIEGDTLSLNMPPRDYFERALRFVQLNYQDQFDNIDQTSFKKLTPEQFLKEYIWCVYVSGFRASVISKLWPKLMSVYSPLFNLETFQLPFERKIDYINIRRQAMDVFAHQRKTDAIIKTHQMLHSEVIEGSFLDSERWKTFRTNNLSTPERLQKLPFIGKITCFHLARNIGLLDFVKPDLHLVRMAEKWHYQSPQALCEDLGEKFDLKPGLVDLVLWYAASTFGTK